MAGPRGIGAIIGPALAGAMVGIGVLAGFYVGRATAPAAAAPGTGGAAAARQPADPAILSRLPAGNLILLDELGKRIYAVPTGSGDPGTQPVDLQGFRVMANGRLAPAGRFRLDPARSTLSDAEGHSFPVEVTPSTGTIRILRGGTLVVNSTLRGARVLLDGRELGRAPQKLVVPAGIHRVRVEGDGWSSASEVDVPAGRSLSITLGPQ